MKDKYRRQVYMGVVGDMKNLEPHYAEMAEKGWMIDKIGLFTHRYRAVAPCQKRFFVDFLPQITAFDYPENEDAQEYRRICADAGWRFMAANKQFHVFCADVENPAPVPIHTDNSIQARIYLKACRKYELPWLLLVLLMFGFASPLDRGAALFLSNISLFLAIGYAFFLIGYLWIIGFVIRWYFRTRKSARNNEPLPLVNRPLARLRSKVFAAGVMAFLICMVLGVALELTGGMSVVFIPVLLVPVLAYGVGLWIRRQIDTKQRTRTGNIALAIGVIIIMEIVVIGGISFITTRHRPSASHSESLNNRPVLTLSDVGVIAAANHSDVRVKGTPAVPVDYAYWESNSEGSVYTQVYRSINKSLTRWLYAHCAEEFRLDCTRRLNAEPEGVIPLTAAEADFWGAEEGLAFYPANSNAVWLLLLKGKTIIRLSAEGEPMRLDTVSQAVQGLWGLK